MQRVQESREARDDGLACTRALAIAIDRVLERARHLQQESARLRTEAHEARAEIARLDALELHGRCGLSDCASCGARP